MQSKFEALVDSDAFVGRFYPDDPHHENALGAFASFEKRDALLATTSMVVAETATVLSYRSGQALARKFLDVIERSWMPVIHVDERLQQEAIRVFRAQETRGTSVVDCTNVVAARSFKIASILSFDRVYSKRFGLRILR